MTPRNTEYTKYDPPGAQVSDDALAQKYLLYTPPARLKLRYRELDDENTTTYGRISSCQTSASANQINSPMITTIAVLEATHIACFWLLAQGKT